MLPKPWQRSSSDELGSCGENATLSQDALGAGGEMTNSRTCTPGQGYLLPPTPGGSLTVGNLVHFIDEVAIRLDCGLQYLRRTIVLRYYGGSRSRHNQPAPNGK